MAAVVAVLVLFAIVGGFGWGMALTLLHVPAAWASRRADEDARQAIEALQRFHGAGAAELSKLPAAVATNGQAVQ